MDYDKFKEEYKKFEEWQQMKDDWEVPNLNDYKEKKEFWENRKDEEDKKPSQRWLEIVDKYENAYPKMPLLHSPEIPPVDNNGDFVHPFKETDMVNSPAHYTRGKQACIDTIEDAIQDAPDPVVGSCHGQILRYLLRLWLKDTPLKNAKKARWYLDRLISHLENQQR